MDGQSNEKGGKEEGEKGLTSTSVFLCFVPWHFSRKSFQQAEIFFKKSEIQLTHFLGEGKKSPDSESVTLITTAQVSFSFNFMSRSLSSPVSRRYVHPCTYQFFEIEPFDLTIHTQEQTTSSRLGHTITIVLDCCVSLSVCQSVCLSACLSLSRFLNRAMIKQTTDKREKKKKKKQKKELLGTTSTAAQ